MQGTFEKAGQSPRMPACTLASPHLFRRTSCASRVYHWSTHFECFRSDKGGLISEEGPQSGAEQRRRALRGLSLRPPPLPRGPERASAGQSASEAWRPRSRSGMSSSLRTRRQAFRQGTRAGARQKTGRLPRSRRRTRAGQRTGAGEARSAARHYRRISSHAAVLSSGLPGTAVASARIGAVRLRRRRRRWRG